MIAHYQPELIKNFVNRHYEISRLEEICGCNEAQIVVVYGRRRIGKTSLLERSFAERKLLKFEGIEGQGEEYQRSSVLDQLARYVGDPYIAKVQTKLWREVFDLIFRYCNEGVWTLYFEEVQWIANYQDLFISELKYYWDNFFRKNHNLIIILCGSSPSFMVGKVLQSRALHNRSVNELPVRELGIRDAQKLLPEDISIPDLFDLYLTFGGIPLYYQYISSKSSPFLSICNQAFRQGGFFVNEWKRIFVSSLGADPLFEQIVVFLANCSSASRGEIAKGIGYSSGGRITTYLRELQNLGLIDAFWPLHIKHSTRLKRYCLKDNFLQFYGRFILPKIRGIEHGEFNNQHAQAIDITLYRQWLGYAFERFCREQHSLIANILGFSAVKYQSGAYFQRKSETTPHGYQVDLCFKRADRTLTVCEIKYCSFPVSAEVSTDLDRKISLIKLSGIRRIEKVLIAANGATKAVQHGPYFDKIITLETLAKALSLIKYPG